MLYLEDFASSVCDCGSSDCDMYVHSECHPEYPTWTRFSVENKCLEVVCCECDALVARLALKSKFTNMLN